MGGVKACLLALGSTAAMAATTGRAELDASALEGLADGFGVSAEALTNALQRVTAAYQLAAWLTSALVSGGVRRTATWGRWVPMLAALES